MTRALLFYNPAAGRFPASRRRIAELAERLLRRGVECTISSTLPPPDPEPWLDLEGQDLIVVHGGDGTIHGVAGQAVRSQLPLGILPAGTANVLARELGISFDLNRAVDIIARGKQKRIHLGQSGERHFLLMAGIGFDACVIANVTPSMKKALGVWAYWVGGMLSLINSPLRPFSVEVEGQVHQATFAVLGNARSYGGQLEITPNARLDEPCLDLCLFTATSKARYLSYLLGVVRANHIDFSDVIYRKVHQVRVQAAPPIGIQMDGELLGGGSVDFRSSPDTLDILVP